MFNAMYVYCLNPRFSFQIKKLNLNSLLVVVVRDKSDAMCRNRGCMYLFIDRSVLQTLYILSQ